jgi:RecA-family ATPase
MTMLRLADSYEFKSEKDEHLAFRNAAEITIQGVEWVWESRLPRGILALSAGKGGAGKSLHAVWMAAAITNGTLPGCFYGKPRRVIWATQEASPEKEVVPRLVAAGADLTLVDFAEVERDDPSSNHIEIFKAKFMDELYDYIKEKAVGLVVLDPLLDVLGYCDTKDQQEVRSVLGRVHEFAEQTGILVLGIAHFNKMSTVDDAIERITGSAAFGQRPRAALVFAYNDEQDTFVLSQGKNNWGRLSLPSLSFKIQEHTVQRGIDTIRLEWAEDSEWSVSDLLAKRHKRADKTKLQQAVQAIRYALRDGPRPKAELLAEIHAAYAIGDRTINEAAKSIPVVAKAQVSAGKRGNPGVLWELP